MKTIHYKHPCGMGNPRTVAMTEDIEKVTCKRCLGTITGQNAAGRPTQGDRPKERINTRIDAALKERAIEASCVPCWKMFE